jgi:hypothetical protein
MIIMKKVMLMMVGMLFIGIIAVQAQSQDTTVAPQQRDTTVTPPQTTPEEQDQQQPEKQEGSYQLRDMTVLQLSEIPSALRETLQGNTEYKGWDDPTTKIYTNKTNDEFVVQIMDGTETKTFRFDKNGKKVEDQK